MRKNTQKLLIYFLFTILSKQINTMTNEKVLLKKEKESLLITYYIMLYFIAYTAYTQQISSIIKSTITREKKLENVSLFSLPHPQAHQVFQILLS